MTHDEYTELKNMIDEIHGGDVRLGRVLHQMLNHLAGKAAEEPRHTEARPVEEEAPAEEAEAPAPSPSRSRRAAQP